MDLNAAQLAQRAADLKSLELLFDYTKFHIGLYLTLASTYITIANVKVGDRLAFTLDWKFVIAAMIAFMAAGFAGGVIVSSITQCYAVAPDCGSTADFLNKPIGPWDVKQLWFHAKYWTYLEHTSFWAGLALAFFSFLRGRKLSSLALSQSLPTIDPPPPSSAA